LQVKFISFTFVPTKQDMNEELYFKLFRQWQDSTNVTTYFKTKDWVDWHLTKLATEFGWLGVGVPVKHTIGNFTRVSNVLSFIVTHNHILVETGFGNVWYHECIKPTEAELKEYDGHCLVCT